MGNHVYVNFEVKGTQVEYMRFRKICKINKMNKSALVGNIKLEVMCVMEKMTEVSIS